MTTRRGHKTVMNSQEHIPNEERDPRFPRPEENPFSVPEGYFEGLAAAVLARVKADEGTQTASQELETLSPLLAGLPRTMPFALPEGYFAANLESLSALTGGDARSTVLEAAGRSMPYAVPEGYFDTLATIIGARLPKPAGRVVSMTRKVYRLAAAAVITGIMAIAGFSYFNGSRTLDTGRPIAHQLNSVSTKELDEFIKTADITPAEVAREIPPATKAEVKQLLNGVPDSEVEAFLAQVPTEEDDLYAIN